MPKPPNNYTLTASPAALSAAGSSAVVVCKYTLAALPIPAVA